MADEIERLKEITRQTSKKLFGEPRKTSEANVTAVDLWKHFFPDLAPHISMFYAGRLYSREVISQKQRELCAVASLTVLDKPNELRAHIIAARNVGASETEIAEVILQQCTYGGVPCMVEGLRTLKEVIDAN